MVTRYHDDIYRMSTIKISEDKTTNSDLSTTPIQTHRRRGRFTPSRKLSAPFKSPLIKKESPVTVEQKCSKKSLQQEIADLKKREAELDGDIEQLIDEGHHEEELQSHIDKLHEYNELKDTAQMLLGQIAIKEGVTTRLLYSRYGLDMED